MLARYAFGGLAAAFLACVLIQVFLAGLAVFVGPANWQKHAAFVHYFELLPVLMLVAGWLGKVPSRLLWQSAGLLGLVYLQYFTANMRAVMPVVAATHPVTALALVWLALVVTLDAWKNIDMRRVA